MNIKNNRVQVFKNVEEFLKVGNLLIKDTELSHLSALFHLSVWCCRKPENQIPRSIFSTYRLLNSYYHQNGSKAGLALAIVKFIDNACKEEDDRNQFSHKLPLSVTAKNINLPFNFVTIRKKLVHSDETLPDEEFEYAFRNSIKWLIDNFWNHQIEEINSNTVNQVMCNELIDKYLELTDESEYNRKKFNENLRSLLSMFNIQLFFDILVSDKYLLNSKYKTRKNLKIWRGMLHFLDEIDLIGLLIETVFLKFTTIQGNSISEPLKRWCTIFIQNCQSKMKNEVLLRFSIKPETVKKINWFFFYDRFFHNCICDDSIDLFRQLIHFSLAHVSEEDRNQVIALAEELCVKNRNICVNNALHYATIGS